MPSGACCQPVKSPASWTDCASGARYENVTFFFAVVAFAIFAQPRSVRLCQQFETARQTGQGELNVLLVRTRQESHAPDAKGLAALPLGGSISSNFGFGGRGIEEVLQHFYAYLRE